MMLHDWIAANSQRQLADAIGVDQSLISRWLRRRVPAERVLAVSRATGIEPAALRPDLASVFAAAPQPNNGTRAATPASHGMSPDGDRGVIEAAQEIGGAA